MLHTKARFRFLFQSALLVSLTAPALYCAIVLDPASVSNAGSFIPSQYPNGGVTRGGTFIVKAAIGSAPLGTCGVSVANKFPIATSMNGTTMKITVGGTSVDVPMIYVVGVSCQTTGIDQLAGIVPTNTPTGKGTLTVAYNGQSGSTDITVVDRGFGFFTINQGGTGAAIIQNFNSATDLVINTLATSAKPGQVAIAWGTGLGSDGHSDVNAPVPTDIAIPLELYVGGQLATVAYKGRSGCCSGIDQIVFTVPLGLDGCYVPVVAKIGNMVSNFTTMSIAVNGGPCSDQNGLTASDITNAQAKNSVVYGILDMARLDSLLSIGSSGGPVTRVDSLAGRINEMSYATFLGLAVRDISTPGTCMVWHAWGPNGNSSGYGYLDGTNIGTIADTPVFLEAKFNSTLNVGTITIQTPSRTVTGSAANAQSYYGDMGGGGYILPPIPGVPAFGNATLDPGTFTITAPGGSTPPNRPTIGALSGQITVPKQPTFSNFGSFDNIDRTSTNANITWTDVDPNALVEIRGYSDNGDGAHTTTAFYCVERGSAGHFVIPPAVLLSMVPTISNGGPGLINAINIGISGTTRFTAPGVDIGFLRYNLLFGKNSSYK